MKKGNIIYVFVFILLCFAVQIVVSLAWAADSGIDGFNAQIFRPAVDGSGTIDLYGSRVPGHLKFYTGMTANFASQPTQVVVPAVPVTVRVQESNTTGDFQFALGISRFAMVGIDIPVIFYQTGQNFPTLSTYRTASMGDVRLDAKFRALEDSGKKPGIAFLSSLSLPSGNPRKFTGDKTACWEGRLIVDKTLGPVSLYSNVGYRFVDAVRVQTTLVDDALTFGAGVRARLPWFKKRMSVVGEFVGQTVLKERKKLTSPMEARGAVQVDLDNGISLSVGGGRGLTDALGSPHYRVFASVGFDFGRRARRDIREIQRIRHVVYFALDSDRISDSDLELLPKLAKEAKDQSSTLTVAGHTDSTGAASYNKKLSGRRAESVRNILMGAGLDESSITVKSYGETIPADSNKTKKGRARNRRVEIDSLQPPVPEQKGF